MNDLPETRQSLLLELGKHNDQAWAEFLVVYEDALYRFCRSKSLQDADSRDVLQKVLAAVHKRIPSWNPDRNRGSFRGWLFRVAKNIAIDAIVERRSKVIATGDSNVDEMLMQIPEERESQETQFEIEYRKSLFDWASTKVKDEVQDATWQSFFLTAVKGLKAEEVANLLSVPTGSVYTAKCRVIARIRSRIESLDTIDYLNEIEHEAENEQNAE